MGKTSLLFRFRDLAVQSGAAVCWSDELDRDPIAVMRSWAQDLDPDGRAFKSFHEQEQAYRERRHELESDPNLPTEVASLLGRAVGRGAVVLGRRVPVAGAALDLVDEDHAGDSLSNAAVLLAQRLRSKTDLLLLSEPLEVLTPAFLEAVSALDGPTVVFFLDTYEATRPYVEQWLLDILAGRLGPLPADMAFVIGGREPLEPNAWGALEDVIARQHLQPFTEAEALHYLRRQQITDARVIDAIMQLSGRMPLLLATLAAKSPDADTDLGDTTDTAIERFLKWVDAPAKRQLALDAALPRYLNEDVIPLLTDDDAGSLYEWLKALPFVTAKSEQRAYHEAVREQMVRQQRRESPSHWAELHDKLAKYYQEQRDLAKSAKDHGRVARMRAEWVYHTVAGSRQVGCGVLSVWARAVAAPDELRALAAAARQAECDAGMENATWGERLLLAADASSDETTTVARCVEAIIKHCESELTPRQHAAILVSRSAYYLSHRQVAPALQDMLQAQELDWSASSELIVAELFAAEGDLDTAVTRIETVLACDEEDLSGQARARAHDRLARVLRRRGDLEEALASADKSVLLDGSGIRTRILRAELMSMVGRVDEALAELAEVAVQRPDHAHEAHHAAARVNVEAGRSVDAEREALSAIDRGPDCLACWGLLGEIKAREDRQTATLPDYFRSLEIACAGHDDVILGKGVAAESAGLIDLARECYSTVIEAHPADARGWAYRGTLLSRENERKEAVNDFTQAIALAPKWWYPRVERASAYALDERFEEALADLEIAGKDPECGPVVWWARASCNHSLNRQQQALRDVDEFIRLVPTDGDGFFLRSRIWIALGESLRALDDAERALDLYPDPPEWLLTNLGLLYSYAERYDEAIAAFEREDDSAIKAYNVAVAAHRAERENSGILIERAQRALETLPEHSHVRLYGMAGLAALVGDENAALSGLRQAMAADAQPAGWAARDMAWRDMRETSKLLALLGET
jgi:tetratricopeptide (TPR) repeat protein